MRFFTNKLLLNLLSCGLVLSYPLAMEGGNKESSAPVPSENAPAKWAPFASEEEGFSVELPKPPEHVSQSITIPQTELKIDYNTYLSEPSENVVFVVSVWNYPAEVNMSNPDINLQDGFEGMLSALPGSQVLNMGLTEVQGFKALEFLVKNDKIYFRGKLILVHNTLYQVFSVYKQQEGIDAEYTHFIESFKLLHPEKRRLTVAPKEGKNLEPKAANKKVKI